MQITFLGTDSVLPLKDNDTACYLIDDETVIDTGLGVYHRLNAVGANRQKIRRLLLTHMHHDHFIGMVSLMFGLGLGHPDRPWPLQVYGPREKLQPQVDRMLAFMMSDTYSLTVPRLEVIGLEPGDTFEAGPYRVSTAATRHGVAGLCYRFDEKTKRLATICGDTAPTPDITELARGSQLFVHEAAMMDTEDSSPGRGHSNAREAAEAAKAAGVGRLALVHIPLPEASKCVALAQPIFPNVFAPKPGEVVGAT